MLDEIDNLNYAVDHDRVQGAQEALREIAQLRGTKITESEHKDGMLVQEGEHGFILGVAGRLYRYSTD